MSEHKRLTYGQIGEIHRLARSGKNAYEISALLAIPRTTIRDTLSGKINASRAPLPAILAAALMAPIPEGLENDLRVLAQRAEIALLADAGRALSVVRTQIGRRGPGRPPNRGPRQLQWKAEREARERAAQQAKDGPTSSATKVGP